MAETGPDKRRHPRRKILRGAKAVFNNGASLYDCQVRDWSESGARLVFPGLTPLPHLFTLRLSDGSEYPCEVVRADGVVVGVRFAGS
ncbi:PilZ domain-containing protein [Dongia sp.]|uniref:PilZ domain-containing protein n=1 Tax=Dongia sp. TaxID=1977262 RepID=UPI0035AEE0A9